MSRTTPTTLLGLSEAKGCTWCGLTWVNFSRDGTLSRHSQPDKTSCPGSGKPRSRGPLYSLEASPGAPALPGPAIHGTSVLEGRREVSSRDSSATGSVDQASPHRAPGIVSAGARDPVHVVELFAGVGGFRLGLERAGGFSTVWFNQWEPSSKQQWAHRVYTQHWPDAPMSNMDVGQVRDVPPHDLLVGGFPCQDYSVANTLASSKGIEGKKGVLWWEIRRILEARRPAHVVLENVDRLLLSPSKQRGRDFAILLVCFRDLGYAVEWRVVNAADYGAAQRRKRVFIYATLHEANRAAIGGAADPSQGPVMGQAFPATATAARGDFTLPATVGEVSAWFGARFLAAGTMVDGKVLTTGVKPLQEGSRALGTVLEACDDASRFLFLDAIEAPRGWRYVKGAKDEQRATEGGFGYRYKEGGLPFPDPLDKAGRTMLTDEGTNSPGRSRHVVADPRDGRLRTLQPVEAERLNDFPDGWTAGAPDRWRFFLMGNALVVGMVERIGRALNASLDAAPMLLEQRIPEETAVAA